MKIEGASATYMKSRYEAYFFFHARVLVWLDQ
jgi:hypothetical protein